VVSTYIKEHSLTQDTVGVLGSEPEICFYSGRHCASSYLYAYPLLEKQKFSGRMQNDMMQELQRAQPRFLVYVDVARSWGTKADIEHNPGFLAEAWEFAHHNYELVDRLAIAGDLEHEWGDRAYLYVFRRRES
jgi:hypothetical protein